MSKACIVIQLEYEGELTEEVQLNALRAALKMKEHEAINRMRPEVEQGTKVYNIYSTYTP